jgi:hypothetical protein
LLQAIECTVDPNTLRSGGKFRKFADWEHAKQAAVRLIPSSRQLKHVKDSDSDSSESPALLPESPGTNCTRARLCGPPFELLLRQPSPRRLLGWPQRPLYSNKCITSTGATCRSFWR